MNSLLRSAPIGWAPTAIEHKGRSLIEELTTIRRPSDAILLQNATTQKTAHDRKVVAVFARAKRQYRLQLPPDYVLAEAHWDSSHRAAEELNAPLQPLIFWGDLETQKHESLLLFEKFNRSRFLDRLSQAGEAVETALATFVEVLVRRIELQSFRAGRPPDPSEKAAVDRRLGAHLSCPPIYDIGNPES